MSETTIAKGEYQKSAVGDCLARIHVDSISRGYVCGRVHQLSVYGDYLWQGASAEHI